ncbi:hypothetical protein V9T40_012823 [Parthenolecanium corni]|uniref:Uncharacterized protein n=1 Tax=Parthenolecanium corni TaxID=536013 RepID=A0AAN9TL18_9HEMI
MSRRTRRHIIGSTFVHIITVLAGSLWYYSNYRRTVNYTESVALAGPDHYDFVDPNEIPDERPKFKIETDYASK